MAPTVRTLDQILSEIGGVYTPQIQSLQTQMADIPSQVQAEEQGLEAKQKTAFGDILNSARRRGTGVAFGGIPASEQAQYTASTYMPALANLRTAAKTQATSLQDAINQIHERRQNAALSLQQNDQSRFDAYQQQQAALAESRRQAAAATSDISKYFSAGAPVAQGQATPQTIGSYSFKNGQDGSGGFAFRDAAGQPIPASQYAKINKIALPTLLMKMASAGDAYAKSAVSSMSGPGGVDPNKFYWLFNATGKPASNGGGAW